MASWPTAPDALGNGASENDLRRIIGAQYMNQGILPNGGLSVSGRTDMSYLVESGAAFMWTSQSQRLGVLVPVESVTTPTEAAPATGSRTDSIYILRDGIPRVTSGSVPSSGVLLGRFIIGAGVTSTRAGQQTIDRDYAIATGTSLGELAHWDGTGIISWSETMPTQRFAQQFVLPSDRMVRLEHTATLTTPDNAKNLPHYVAFTYIFDDGEWTKRSYFQADPTRQTRSVTYQLTLPAGVHSLAVQSHVRSSNGSQTNVDKIYVSESWDTAMEMSLWDMGPSQ